MIFAALLAAISLPVRCAVTLPLSGLISIRYPCVFKDLAFCCWSFPSHGYSFGPSRSAALAAARYSTRCYSSFGTRYRNASIVCRGCGWRLAPDILFLLFFCFPLNYSVERFLLPAVVGLAYFPGNPTRDSWAGNLANRQFIALPQIQSGRTRPKQLFITSRIASEERAAAYAARRRRP